MRKIFATIFYLAILPALAGAPPTMSGEADPEVTEKLGNEAAALASLFRSPWRNARSALGIVFSPAVPELSAEVVPTPDGRVLMLNGSPGRWDSDFGLRRKVYSALLMAAAGVPAARGECRALPPWVVAAATRRLAAQHGEERLLGGNFRAPVLRALLESGKLPPARIVQAADPEQFTPATLAWTEELAAALFLAGGKRLASAEYLRRCGENAAKKRPSVAADLVWMPRTPEQLEARFADFARRMAWHELDPRPARWALKRLEELRRIKLPELDESGKPVPDKFIECDVLELSERLKGRPDAAAQASAAHQRFFEFCTGDSRRVKTAGALFTDLVGYADKPPLWYSSKLKRALDRLYAELRRREKLGRFLDEADLRYAPVRRCCRNRLKSMEYLDRCSLLIPTDRREWFSDRVGEDRP